jgi:hypothetical protein
MEALRALRAEIATLKEAVEMHREQVKGLGLIRHGVSLWRTAGGLTQEATDALTEGLYTFTTHWARNVAHEQQAMENAIAQRERFLAQATSDIIVPDIAIVNPDGSPVQN